MSVRLPGGSRAGAASEDGQDLEMLRAKEGDAAQQDVEVAMSVGF